MEAAMKSKFTHLIGFTISVVTIVTLIGNINALPLDPLPQANTSQIFVDDFNDNSLDSHVWNNTQWGVGPTVSEVNNHLEITIPQNSQNGPADVFGAGYTSNCLLAGDFDIQVDYALMAWPSTNGVRVGLTTATADGYAGGIVERVSLGPPSDIPEAPRETYLVHFANDIARGFVATSDLTGKLRLVRSGNAQTGYYYHANDWVELFSGYAPTSAVEFTLQAWSHNGKFSNQEVKIAFDNFKVNQGQLSCSCSIPFFSQVDENWADHPLRTSDGKCSAYYGTIGHGGCTLTSAAMVFRIYGTDLNPPQLSDCMGDSACPYNWPKSPTCSSGKAKYIGRPGFDWTRLDQELNQNHRPVILGMCRNGTCQYDYDNDPNTWADTHWVVVLSGQGNDPANYRINDPAKPCSTNIPLSVRSTNYTFTWMGIYDGQVPCNALTVEVPACVARGSNPVPVQLASLPSGSGFLDDSHTSSSFTSVISGTVWIYTMTDITMTVEITAHSSISNVTQMLIWSDSISNTTWQPFTPFVWLPMSDFVYAQFQDGLGNITDVYSDTIYPVGPPTAPIFPIYLPLVRK